MLSSGYLILFLFLLVLVSFLYAGVGHGGASGYLALMALFAFPIAIMKPTALLLNIFVSGISFAFFTGGKHFKWKLFYPFAITSVPAAFLGGYLSIDATLYKQILAIFLMVGVLRILGVFGKEKERFRSPNLISGLFTGLGIGLFSGMIGIGGGIILSPVIVLMGWGNIKQSAAVSALFIFVNSVSGLIGFSAQGGTIPSEALLFVPAVLIGGAIGAFYGSQRLSPVALKYVLSGVLGLACVKLMMI